MQQFFPRDVYNFSGRFVSQNLKMRELMQLFLYNMEIVTWKLREKIGFTRSAMDRISKLVVWIEEFAQDIIPDTRVSDAHETYESYLQDVVAEFGVPSVVPNMHTGLHIGPSIPVIGTPNAHSMYR